MRDEVIHAFTSVVGADHIRTDAASLEAYGVDALG